jgi:hypothetical protein
MWWVEEKNLQVGDGFVIDRPVLLQNKSNNKTMAASSSSRQLVLILAGAVCNIWDFILVHSYARIGLYLCSRQQRNH